MEENNMGRIPMYDPPEWLNRMAAHYDKECTEMEKAEEAFENTKNKMNLDPNELQHMNEIQNSIHEINTQRFIEMSAQLNYTALRCGMETGMLHGYRDSLRRCGIELSLEELHSQVSEYEGPKEFLAFIENFAGFFHASYKQVVPNGFILDWTTVNHHQPITTVFLFKYTEANVVPIQIIMYGLSVKPVPIFECNASFDSVNGRIVFDPNFIQELDKSGKLMTSGAITFETFSEINVCSILFNGMNFKLRLNMSQLNDEAMQWSNDFAIRNIDLFGVKCGHVHFFDEMNEEVRNKLIEICMDENRGDLAEILRQNKND